VKEEPVDILDEQGNKTGQTMLKSEAHAKSLWHPVAHLWIYNSKNQVLIQKRAAQKLVWPNKWDVAIAGHITAGDSPRDTVVREAEEEMSIKVNPEDIKIFDISKFEDKMPEGWFNRVYIYSYITKMDLNIAKLVLEADETSQVRWVDTDKLEEELHDPKSEGDFSPPAKLFFQNAIDEIRKKEK
jgi:isopentenyldiphosphate isomerase